MGILGKTLPWLLAKGGTAVSWLKGAGWATLGAVGIGTGAAVVDVAANEGKNVKGVVNSAVDLYNETLNTAAVDLDNTQNLLNTQAEGMSWFNSINAFFYSLCDFVGFEQGKEFFTERMERTNTEVRDFIDDQRDALTEQNGKSVGESIDDPAIDAGEVSFGSAFGSAAYGLETGVVSIGTGITSLVTGSYEALTTDKGWGESISTDFNAQQGYVMDKLEGLHGKPDMDTPVEKGLNFAGEIASWLVPVGLAAKGTGSIVAGLANITPKALPAVGPAAKLIP
jgi:hypothetical protein